MANSSVAMDLRSRRPIHCENHAKGDETNEQVQKICYVCGQLKSVEGNIEDEQLGNQPENNYHSKKNPDSSETEHFICKDCGTNATNQKNVYEVAWTKSAIVISIIVVVLLFATFAIYNYLYAEKTFEVKVQNQTQDEIDFDDELYGLEDKYKQQDDRVWYTFAAGIKSVIAEKPNKPSVFLLLYDNDRAENTVKCLAQDVTKAASKYLMKRETKPLIYAGADLNQEPILNDPGQLLVLYKDRITTSGAMIITNLQDVHPKVATSFHFFCDRYSPLVEKAIFLFTLKVNNVPNAPLQKVAEDALQSLWAEDLPENILNPLITRMTGNVLRIFKDYSNCYL